MSVCVCVDSWRTGSGGEGCDSDTHCIIASRWDGVYKAPAWQQHTHINTADNRADKVQTARWVSHQETRTTGCNCVWLFLLADILLFPHLFQTFSLEEHNMRILLLVAGEIFIFYSSLSVSQTFSENFQLKLSRCSSGVETWSWSYWQRVGFPFSQRFQQLITPTIPFSSRKTNLNRAGMKACILCAGLVMMARETLTLILLVWDDKDITSGKILCTLLVLKKLNIVNTMTFFEK